MAMNARLVEALKLYKSGQIDKLEQVLKVKNTAESPTIAETGRSLGGGYSSSTMRSAPGAMGMAVSTNPPSSSEESQRLSSLRERAEGDPEGSGEISAAPSLGENGPKESEVPTERQREVEEQMIKWLQTDDDLRRLAKIKKDLTRKKQLLTEQLMEFMDQWKVPEVALDDDHTVSYKIKEIKQGYSKKLITEVINDLFTPEQSEYLLAELENRRKTVEKPSLLRSTKK